MNRERAITRSFVFCALIGILMSAALITPARADFIDSAFQDIDAACDDGMGGDRSCDPSFTFKFSAWKTILDQCSGDDVTACADSVAANPEAQQAGVPSFLPQMINIYFDVKKKDYWGLLADGGKTIACAAALVITDIDVCGALQTLADTAEAALNTAEKAAQFLADLGGDLVSGLKNLGCSLDLWGGCDSSSAPSPTPQQLAQAFLAAQVTAGVQHIEISFSDYVDFEHTLPGLGQSQGLSYQKIVDLLGWYDSQVLPQWDNWVVQNKLAGYANAIAVIKNPATLNALVSDGAKLQANIDWNPNLDLTLEPYDTKTREEIMTMLSPLWADSITYCQNTLDAAGGAVVRDWLQQGRPAAANLPAPADPDQACQNFNFQLKQRLAATANLSLIVHWTSGCALGKSNEFSCDNALDYYRCNAAHFFVVGKLLCAGGPAPASGGSQPSGGGGPNYQYLCGPNNTPTLSPLPTPPQGCHKIPPIKGSGGMNGSSSTGSSGPVDNR